MKRVTGIVGIFFNAKAPAGEGCQVLDKTDDSEYGKFGWVIDREGSKLALWQPPAGR